MKKGMPQCFFKAVIFCLTWTLFICVSQLRSYASGTILRMPCEVYANFSYTRKDEVLQGSVLATFLGKSALECQTECADKNNCKSINVEKSGNRQCELNAKSAADASDGVSLVSKAGWTFQSSSFSDPLIGKTCREKNPCGDYMVCIDTCVCPGYRCYLCNEIDVKDFCKHDVTNIAKSKPTYQSSTMDALNSSLAVDGLKNKRTWLSPPQDYKDGFHCSHTDNLNNPWWSVNFQAKAVVLTVVVYDREDCCHERMSNFDIRIGDHNSNRHRHNTIAVKSASVVGDNHASMIKIAPPKEGRYLFIEQNLPHDLALCEVEVYGFFK